MRSYPLAFVIFVNAIFGGFAPLRTIAQDSSTEDLLALSNLLADLNTWLDQSLEGASGVEVININNQVDNRCRSLF